MTNAIDNAIARIQNIALALSTLTDVAGNAVTIKEAPDYPLENEPPLPAAFTYVAEGSFQVQSKSQVTLFPVVATEFHFSRTNLKQAYLQTNAVVHEFPRRIAGDPQLDGAVDTVIMTADNGPTYSVRPFLWREKTATAPALLTHCVTFRIPLKLIESPTATST